MKLWLLRPNEQRKDKGISNVDPWEPWYDKCFGAVVRAETEKQARAMVEPGDEGGRLYWMKYKKNPWLDPEMSTCEELAPNGDAGLIIKDFWKA